MRSIRFESGPPILAVTIFLLVGCASAPPPMEFAREAGPKRYCPLPMLWEDGKPRPVRLRVHNKTEYPISVWLDNCDGHIRLGDLQPGHFSGLRLPSRLIPFNDQIRVHTFDVDRMAPFASYAVDLSPEWTLRLDVDEDTPELNVVYGPEDTRPEWYVGLNGFMVFPGANLSYASRQAEQSAAMLTWQCVEGERQVTLSTGTRLPDGVEVTVGFEGGGDSLKGSWFVHHGMTDSAVAPGEVIESLTLKALAVSVMELGIRPVVGNAPFTFKVSGLAQALNNLGCYSSLMASR